MMRILLAGSGVQSNMTFQWLPVNDLWLIRRYSPAPPALNVCACSVAFDCPKLGGNFFCMNGNNCTAGTLVSTTPGMTQSCVDLESVLKSDFSCFFNQTCLNIFLSMYNVDMPTRLPLPAATIAIPVLNSSASSRFLPNDTLSTIFDQLMVETWDIQTNFEGYYNICAPTICTYTFSQRLDILYTVATIVGLIGGLLVTFRLLVPILVRLAQWSMVSWRNRYAGNSHDRPVGDAGKKMSVVS